MVCKVPNVMIKDYQYIKRVKTRVINNRITDRLRQPRRSKQQLISLMWTNYYIHKKSYQDRMATDIS